MPTIGSSRRGFSYGCSVAVGLAMALSTAVSPALAAGPPENDLFQNARPLTGQDIQFTDDNTGASKEPGEPNHAGRFGGASLWYSWTAPTGGNTTVRAGCFPGDIDTVLGIYTGSSVSGLTHIASNDDATCGTGSIVTFVAQAGTTYRIAVDGFSGAMGQFHFDLVVVAQCRDAIDNDGDGLVDSNDPGCTSGQDGDENESGPAQIPPKLLSAQPVRTLRLLSGRSGSGRAARTSSVKRTSGRGVRLRVVPNCQAKHYSARVRLLRLTATGKQVGHGKTERFRCRKAHARILRRSSYTTIPPKWWRRAHTQRGITLVAVFRRRGVKQATVESIGLHSPSKSGGPAGQSETMPRATASTSIQYPTLLGCTGSYYGTGGSRMVLLLDRHYYFGAAEGDYVYVAAYGQTFYPNYGYGGWKSADKAIAYYAAPEGNTGNVHILGGGVALTLGGTGVLGQVLPRHTWNGVQGYPAQSQTYAQIGVWIWTPRTGWYWREVSPDPRDTGGGAIAYGDWCYFP
jgi:hypothetical protein